MNGLGTTHTSEDTYRKEWAALTGRRESEIYIPAGLRADESGNDMGNENDDTWCQSTEENPNETYEQEVIVVQSDTDG